MAKRVPKNVWFISDGKECATFNVNIGGLSMPLPLILASRREARQVMKAYPMLSVNCSIRKAPNRVFGE